MEFEDVVRCEGHDMLTGCELGFALLPQEGMGPVLVYDLDKAIQRVKADTGITNEEYVMMLLSGMSVAPNAPIFMRLTEPTNIRWDERENQNGRKPYAITISTDHHQREH